MEVPRTHPFSIKEEGMHVTALKVVLALALSHVLRYKVNLERLLASFINKTFYWEGRGRSILNVNLELW